MRWPTLFLALGGALLTAAPARAHRLEADYRVLPGRRVQVESWFDLTGASPRGAKVQVFRKNGELLTEGQLDDKGLYLFSCPRAEALRVVVSAGAGHRKELEISAAELENAPRRPAAPTDRDAPDAGAVPPPALGGSADPDEPFADRRSRISAKDVLIGVGFVLAAAAFVLSIRTARRLRELQRR